MMAFDDEMSSQRLLAQAIVRLGRGFLELESEEGQYVFGALRAIARGDNAPDAFDLPSRPGPKAKLNRDYAIFNRVNELVLPQSEAFAAVADEFHLSADAVDKAYRKGKQASEAMGWWDSVQPGSIRDLDEFT